MALAIAPAVHASEIATIPADYTIAPLTVEQYHAMTAAGILEKGAPIELLEGYLVEKSIVIGGVEVGRLAVRDLLP